MIKKVFSSLVFFALCCSAASSHAEMTPPKPVDNKLFDAMVGTWKGESDMMGKKMKDTLHISWGPNHQFLILQLTSKEEKNPANPYEGLGVFGVDAKGDVKTWWFDSWGIHSAATGSGKAQNNQLVIQDSNANFKEQRSFSPKGNTMVMQAKGTMKMADKEMPFEQTVTYKK